VDKKQMGRMLLSHNFNLTENMFPKLSREEFCQVFVEALSDRPSLHFRLVDNPHWMVEVLYSIATHSASEVGEFCAIALQQKRLSQAKETIELPDILILGGIKTTPATSTSPDSLQPGEWGVDVVETAVGEEFLTSIGWENAIASKPADSIFKVELKNK
jgi:hypothetical protein